MKKLLASLFVVSLFVWSCQKENSFENGAGESEGLLQSDVSGDCLPKQVLGTYVEGTALNGANEYIEVTVDVLTTGAYTIYSDTLNGVFFRASGIFTGTGMQTVKLRGNGVPAADGPINFTITYGDQTCNVLVEFLPTGAGGPAVFTLPGNACPGTPPTAAGTYAVGVMLGASNTVDIPVNVTTIGTYTISTTTVQGMTFTKTGTFTTTGPQTVTLVGSGTPTGAAGPVTVNYTVNSVACTFTVTLQSAGAFTYNCGTASVNGTYTENIALVPADNFITIDITGTAAGPASITASIGNMTFTWSGTVALGVQQITLAGSNTPNADGNFNLILPGATPCTVPITVVPGPTIDWKFTMGTSTYQGSTDLAEIDGSTAPFTFFIYDGVDGAGDQLMSIGLLDLSGGIANGETYKSNTTTSNLGTFYFDVTSTGESYEADPTITGTLMTITITSHTPATKTIKGTFSGTVKEATAGTVHTITNGQFTAVYP
ncbi:MAG TPA: hypothetical protein VHM26_17805 [Chitinophagaceae bacterium]|nr:hypothetical protein [Chitinophagaceae bacterium]